jgi:hypothetical protein
MAERTVWKFPLHIDPLTVQFTQVQRIPEGARFLHCAAQGNDVALWYEIPDPEAETVERGFQIFGTGNGPIGDHLTYIGTAQFVGALLGGSLVLHVYEDDRAEGN